MLIQFTSLYLNQIITFEFLWCNYIMYLVIKQVTNNVINYIGVHYL
jgi:hypothetical protein